jgi:hypothetical protein
MKIGDLVKWNGSTDFTVARPDTGIVVGGPREGGVWHSDEGDVAISYEVAWFDAKTIFWHSDEHLEVLSENR